jgi:phosphatidylglycerol:prolipoprotein diacylglycerol transferase
MVCLGPGCKPGCKVDFAAIAPETGFMKALIPFPDIAPELFSISLFGTEFALRWYALAYIVGILLAWRIMHSAAKSPALWRDQSPAMTTDQVGDLITWVILGIILGGRLGYVLFYQPAFFMENPGKILNVWEGGMSFHGGLLGVILAGLIFTYKNNIPRLGAADLMALGTPAGLLLGRIANFINAELWGRPTDLPWGVAFPTQAAQTCPEIAGLCARHPSQLYEALLEGLLLGLLLLWLAWRRGALMRPGQLAGLFFTGYGIARFAVEFVRQPDAQFVTEGNPLGLAWQINGLGLTMGQILSLPMIGVGLLLVLHARRKRHVS